MNKDEFQRRTKAYALRIIRVVGALPKTQTASVIGKQLLRCGTSVGANYRAACCARSSADFISKIGIVHEEADESIFWMELLVESDIVPEAKLADLIQEGKEIVAMVVSSLKTARAKNDCQL